MARQTAVQMRVPASQIGDIDVAVFRKSQPLTGQSPSQAATGDLGPLAVEPLAGLSPVGTRMGLHQRQPVPIRDKSQSRLRLQSAKRRAELHILQRTAAAKDPRNLRIVGQASPSVPSSQFQLNVQGMANSVRMASMNASDTFAPNTNLVYSEDPGATQPEAKSSPHASLADIKQKQALENDDLENILSGRNSAMVPAASQEFLLTPGNNEEIVNELTLQLQNLESQVEYLWSLQALSPSVPAAVEAEITQTVRMFQNANSTSHQTSAEYTGTISEMPPNAEVTKTTEGELKEQYLSIGRKIKRAGAPKKSRSGKLGKIGSNLAQSMLKEPSSKAELDQTLLLKSPSGKSVAEKVPGAESPCSERSGDPLLANEMEMDSKSKEELTTGLNERTGTEPNAESPSEVQLPSALAPRESQKVQTQTTLPYLHTSSKEKLPASLMHTDPKKSKRRIVEEVEKSHLVEVTESASVSQGEGIEKPRLVFNVVHPRPELHGKPLKDISMSRSYESPPVMRESRLFPMSNRSLDSKESSAASQQPAQESVHDQLHQYYLRNLHMQQSVMGFAVNVRNLEARNRLEPTSTDWIVQRAMEMARQLLAQSQAFETVLGTTSNRTQTSFAEALSTQAPSGMPTHFGLTSLMTQERPVQIRPKVKSPTIVKPERRWNVVRPDRYGHRKGQVSIEKVLLTREMAENRQYRPDWREKVLDDHAEIGALGYFAIPQLPEDDQVIFEPHEMDLNVDESESTMEQESAEPAILTQSTAQTKYKGVGHTATTDQIGGQVTPIESTGIKASPDKSEHQRVSQEAAQLFLDTQLPRIVKPASPNADIKKLGALEFSGVVQAAGIVRKLDSRLLTAEQQLQQSEQLLEVSRELYSNLKADPFVGSLDYWSQKRLERNGTVAQAKLEADLASFNRGRKFDPNHQCLDAFKRRFCGQRRLVANSSDCFLNPEQHIASFKNFTRLMKRNKGKPNFETAAANRFLGTLFSDHDLAVKNGLGLNYSYDADAFAGQESGPASVVSHPVHSSMRQSQQQNILRSRPSDGSKVRPSQRTQPTEQVTSPPKPDLFDESGQWISRLQESSSFMQKPLSGKGLCERPTGNSFAPYGAILPRSADNSPKTGQLTNQFWLPPIVHADSVRNSSLQRQTEQDRSVQIGEATATSAPESPAKLTATMSIPGDGNEPIVELLKVITQRTTSKSPASAKNTVKPRMKPQKPTKQDLQRTQTLKQGDNSDVREVLSIQGHNTSSAASPGTLHAEGLPLSPKIQASAVTNVGGESPRPSQMATYIEGIADGAKSLIQVKRTEVIQPIKEGSSQQSPTYASVPVTEFQMPAPGTSARGPTQHAVAKHPSRAEEQQLRTTAQAFPSKGTYHPLSVMSGSYTKEIVRRDTATQMERHAEETSLRSSRPAGSTTGKAGKLKNDLANQTVRSVSKMDFERNYQQGIESMRASERIEASLHVSMQPPRIIQSKADSRPQVAEQHVPVSAAEREAERATLESRSRDFLIFPPIFEGNTSTNMPAGYSGQMSSTVHTPSKDTLGSRKGEIVVRLRGQKESEDPTSMTPQANEIHSQTQHNETPAPHIFQSFKAIIQPRKQSKKKLKTLEPHLEEQEQLARGLAVMTQKYSRLHESRPGLRRGRSEAEQKSFMQKRKQEHKEDLQRVLAISVDDGVKALLRDGWQTAKKRHEQLNWRLKSVQW